MSRSLVAWGDHPPRLRRKAVAFPMIEFVRPGSYWPHPFSIEQAFGVMQAAIASAGDVHGLIKWRGWHRTGLIDHLVGGGGFGHGNTVSVKSIDDLKAVFHRLVLGRTHAPIEEWRHQAGVDVVGTFSAAFPHYRPFQGAPLQGRLRACEADIRKALTWLLEGSRGKLLAASLNRVHLRAREVGDVVVKIGATSFVFDLEYKLDGSHWFETLARSRDGEPFIATLDRAINRMRLFMGEGHSDPASLCLALNRSDNTTSYTAPRESFWALGPRPVKQPVYGDTPISRFMTVGGNGYGRTTLTIVEVPSGTIVARDPFYDWKRMKALLGILHDRFPEGTAVPAPAQVAAMMRDETSPMEPRFDDQGRSLYDRDGKLLAAEVRASKRPAVADVEIEADCLF